MNSFWGNLLEHLKSDSAWLFVPALLTFFGLIVGGSIVYDKVSPETFFSGLIGLGVIALALVWRTIHRARRRSRYEASPFSFIA